MQGSQQDWGRSLMQKSGQEMMVAWTIVSAVDEKKWTDLRMSDLRGRSYRS